MIQITDKPISPELVVNKVKTDSSGCVSLQIYKATFGALVAYVLRLAQFTQRRVIRSIISEIALS